MGNLLSHVRFYDFSELAGVRYETLFDSIDGWTKNIQGDATIVLAPASVQISGGVNVGSYGDLNKFMEYGHWSPDFYKKRLIRTKIEFSFKATGSEDNFFGTGYLPTPGHGFGFRFMSDRITGYASNDADITEVDLIPGLVAPYSDCWLLEALLYPNVRVEFKVGGVWKANITTTLPFGDDFSGKPLSFKCSKGAGLSHVMRFSSALFFQDQ